MKAVKTLVAFTLAFGATMAMAQDAASAPASAASSTYVAPPWTYKTKQLTRLQVDALLGNPKKLLIIDLANQIPIKNGELDYAELADRQPEINLAIAEAKVYGAHTLQAVDALIRLRAREEV